MTLHVLQNEAIDGVSAHRHTENSVGNPAGVSTNGVEPSAAGDTPGSGDRLSMDDAVDTPSPLHHQYPSPSAATHDDVEMLRVQLRNETRRVRYLEELLQYRFSDAGDIREVQDNICMTRAGKWVLGFKV